MFVAREERLRGVQRNLMTIIKEQREYCSKGYTMDWWCFWLLLLLHPFSVKCSREPGIVMPSQTRHGGYIQINLVLLMLCSNQLIMDGTSHLPCVVPRDKKIYLVLMRGRRERKSETRS
jgi:hypothetical protein